MGLTPEQVAAVGGIISAVILAGAKRFWVWGWSYQAVVEDRDFWRKIALQSMGHAEKAIDIAAKKVEVA
jgi:hypothetical protein